MNNAFSCFIVGDDNLTLQCAKTLIEQGHRVLGLVSPSKHVKEWCERKSMFHIQRIKDFNLYFGNVEFDYLFSIVNGQIVPNDILKRPRHLSINYHNSPLPKYAGLYATSWAILNGEEHHAISWHVMDDKVDAGAILEQPSFAIEPDDTALSLNIKCFEHAISSFNSLIKKLSEKSVILRSQDLSSRTYFGLKDKPNNLGVINWEYSAQEIDKTYRALTLGNYTNQLATPKVVIGDELFIVKSLKKLNSRSLEKPGTIVSITNECIQVATGTNDVAIYQLESLDGTDQIRDVIEKKPECLTDSLLKCIKVDNTWSLKSDRFYKQEAFWVKEFLKSIPDNTFLPHSPKTNVLKCHSKNIIPIPQSLMKKISAFSDGKKSSQTILLAVALIYLFRLNNYRNLSVAYSDELLKKESKQTYQFLSDTVPFTTCFDSSMTFRQAIEVVSEKRIQLGNNKTFAKDIFVRYPELSPFVHPMALGVEFVDESNLFMNQFDGAFAISFLEDCSGFYINHNVQDTSIIRSHSFLEHISEHFLTLLDDSLRNVDKNIFELSILSHEEKNDLLIHRNMTESTFNKEMSLHQYFEDQVIKTPDVIAAVFEGKSISYFELNNKANILAHFLKKEGVIPNQQVGICINRSLEMLICILGVLKAGAAYLPLDPNYPEERISYMLQNSESPWLLMDKGTIKNRPEGYAHSIFEISSILENNNSRENIPSINKPSDLAYVIYTSGSTGKPKGVAISHEAICNHMLWMKGNYQFCGEDVFLQKTPFSFDASVWEFFMPLFVGAKLIIAPDYAYASSDQLTHLVQEYNVSVLQLVPTMLKKLVTTENFASCNSLKYVFCGGEALTPETISVFFGNNHSNAKLYNLYGPTESTIDAVTYTCKAEDGESDINFIGHPIANTKVYVLDECLQPVPEGITGELYLSGVGLARGYINNTEDTAKKFIANPFNSEGKSRLYKTGDLVKWNSNGALEYHGRCDHQVKIRGYRVELTEIEFFLDKVLHVSQSVVIPELDHKGQLSLSAYLELNNPSEIFVSDIRKQLNKVLPDYMIPGRFFLVDKFLTTPGGKIDRKNIPVALREIHLKKKQSVPQNKTEHVLQKIWSTVLKMDDVGVDDNFFDLGGDSLSAMEIVSLIQEGLSNKVAIKTLFECPNIKMLAKEIMKHESTTEILNGYLVNSPVITLKEGGNKTPLFLVHPIGGSIFWYKDLGLYLDEEQPLFGIQDPGLETSEYLFESLEEMASYYIDALQVIQPKGPYLLGGASFGTTVAIEMARQLEEKGETVASILSLDGWAHYPSLKDDEKYFKKMMVEQNKKTLRKNNGIQISNLDFVLKLQWHREQMLTRYNLPTTQAKFILFKAQELSTNFQYEADLNWWDSYIKNQVELHVVPGNHESMFSKPNIQVLADKINKVLHTKRSDVAVNSDALFKFLETIS